jgi:bisphosphoglycerate-independent phosphoglycerate mutase (AlkP superfamily)
MGHEQDAEGAMLTLRGLARFVRAVLEETDLGRVNVLLTSDHGNVEDLSVRNHTLNDVPTLAWGPARARVRERVSTLADVTPTILEILRPEEATA